MFFLLPSTVNLFAAGRPKKSFFCMAQLFFFFAAQARCRSANYNHDITHIKTQRKVVSDFAGKIGAFFTPPLWPLFFFGKKFFSDLLQEFPNVFSMKLTVKNFRNCFSIKLAVKNFRIFFSMKLTAKKVLEFFLNEFSSKNFPQFFAVNFIKKNFEKFLIVNLRLLKNFLLLNSLKKNSKFFYSQFDWKNISKFFQKIRKKIFCQKKKGSQGRWKMHLFFQQNLTRPFVGFWHNHHINSEEIIWKSTMRQGIQKKI